MAAAATVRLVCEGGSEPSESSPTRGILSAATFDRHFPVFASCTDDATTDSGDGNGTLRTFELPSELAAPSIDLDALATFLVAWAEANDASPVPMGEDARAVAPTTCLGLRRDALVRSALEPFAAAEGTTRVFLSLLVADGADVATMIRKLAHVHRVAVDAGCVLLQAQAGSVLAGLIREAAVVGDSVVAGWFGAAPGSDAARSEALSNGARWTDESLRGCGV